MREVMMEADLPPPEFSQKQSGIHTVRVTLKNNIEFRKVFLNSKTEGLVSERIYSTLTDEEKVIINYIAEKGRANVTQIVLVLSVDWQTAKNYLTNLVDAGILQIKGDDKPRNANKRYILKVKDAAQKI